MCRKNAFMSNFIVSGSISIKRFMCYNRFVRFDKKSMISIITHTVAEYQAIEKIQSMKCGVFVLEEGNLNHHVKLWFQYEWQAYCIISAPVWRETIQATVSRSTWTMLRKRSPWDLMIRRGFALGATHISWYICKFFVVCYNNHSLSFSNLRTIISTVIYCVMYDYFYSATRENDFSQQTIDR